MELAVTGRAFEVLRTSNLMEKLLFYTRIFARFKPEDKVWASIYFLLELWNFQCFSLQLSCEIYQNLISTLR